MLRLIAQQLQHTRHLGNISDVLEAQLSHLKKAEVNTKQHFDLLKTPFEAANARLQSPGPCMLGRQMMGSQMSVGTRTMRRQKKLRVPQSELDMTTEE